MGVSTLARGRRLVVRGLRRVGVLRPRICLLVGQSSPGEPDADDLDATLHRLRALPHADLVVMAAVSPEDERAREIVRSHEQADWRVRGLLADDWSTAAATAAAARGRYYVALARGDLPDVQHLDAAVRALDARSLGLAVGTGVGLADPAEAVLGRRTWCAVAGAASAESALVEALALVRDPVSLAAEATQPEPAPSVRGMRDTRPALPGWIDLHDTAVRVLGADPDLHGRWAASVLARHTQPFLEDVERLDDEQWSALHNRVEALARSAGPDNLGLIPVEGRVRVALAAAGRRGELIGFIADRRFAGGHFATEADDGVVCAVLPVPADLPRSLVRLSAAETALHTSVRRLRWTADELELEIFACVAGVDLAVHRPEATAALVGARRVQLPVRVLGDREVTRWMGTHEVNHDLGKLRIRVPLAELAVPGEYQLEVSLSVAGVTRTGRVTAHDPSGSAAMLRPRTYAGTTVAAQVDPGFALVAKRGEGPERSRRSSDQGEIHDLVVDGARLVVRGSNVDRLVLAGPPEASRLRRRGDVSKSDQARWSLRHDPWRFGQQPLPTGRYVLAAHDGRGVQLAEALADRLPETLLSEDYRVVVRREPRKGGHALAITLGPPLADDEVGPYCQRRLQEWYADEAHELDRTSVYLQAYTGQNATDSPLAIADELARTRRDLRLVWAVADRAARVPPGADTVLWRSRAWYAALARSGYVVTNIELEAWFRRRPGQEVVQTFHGYPSKAMGIGLWRQKNFTESRIEQQLDRTSRNWSLLLTPAPEMDVHYRENYRYDGPILAAGYPRDDLLASEAAAEVRDETRQRLGIADGVVAVLYAPTWRDDQATTFRSARPVDHLDVRATAAALGPGHVLLLRGHRFMAPTGGDSASRVLDVTTYPEINDLVLAADVAVLDYSSLRFDFGVTGKPMVFLVPDLDDYATAKRGFLYDFRETAPGPLLRSSGEVIEALGDLDALRREHGEAYDRFNQTYNRFQDGAAAGRVVARVFG